MHEMSIAQSVLRIVEANARRAGLARVSRVRVEIGRLAAVEPQSLEFCFGAVVAGSVADGAALEIVETAGRAWCMRCSGSVEVASRLDDCPRCGSAQLQVTAGEAMRVLDLEGS